VTLAQPMPAERLTVPVKRGVRPGRREIDAPDREPAGALRAWPLVGLLLLYPLWWALGLGVLIFPMAAVPMAYMLLRYRLLSRRPVNLPPGFAWWALFLLTVVISIGALGENPAGTVTASISSRLVAVIFRLIEYGSLTVTLLFAGNLSESRLSRRRLVRLLAWLFGVTVAGGVLGMVAGDFEFASPVEMLLPGRWRDLSFVASLVHPAAAQVMNVLGHVSARPAAPWGYTNTWGNNFLLLVVWFVAAAYGYRGRHRVLATLLLALSILPVVYSLNRGLWIGLGVSLAYLVLRLAVRGRVWIFGVLGGVAVALLIALIVSPLGTVVSQRLDHGRSNGVRMYLTNEAISDIGESPIIGFGSTRNTEGGRNSIAVGESADCPHCGNFTIGGNGQLWQVLYAHGVVGTVTYFGFFGYGLWRFRRDRTAIGLAASTAIVGSFVSALWYNSLATPLAFTLLAYALLWRNQAALFGRDQAACDPTTHTEGEAGR
jgi:hypothetical protein